MRFTKEFKLECIRKYKSGERIDDPGGCKHSTFCHMVLQWVRIYNALGEAGLEHKKPKRSWKNKMDMIQRVLDGESITEVACSNSLHESLLSKWLKIYQEFGIVK